MWNGCGRREVFFGGFFGMAGMWGRLRREPFSDDGDEIALRG